MDNLAHANFLSNNDDQVLNLFLKSFKIRDSIDDKPGKITNALHLSEYYRSKNNNTLSIKYARIAKDVSLDIRNNEELLKSYKILSEICERDEGLAYSKAYIQLNDSLVKEERLFRDKFARIQFETEEKEQEIEEKNRTNRSCRKSKYHLSFRNVIVGYGNYFCHLLF